VFFAIFILSIVEKYREEVFCAENFLGGVFLYELALDVGLDVGGLEFCESGRMVSFFELFEVEAIHGTAEVVGEVFGDGDPAGRTMM